MTSLKSQDVSPAAHKGYDTEIVDMAKYIHGYKIDSELAVSKPIVLDLSRLTQLSTTQLVLSSSTLLVAV